MKKIYVATDFSDVAKNAVHYASGFAQDMKCSLTIVNFYESPLYYTAEMPYTAIEAAEKLAREESENKMGSLLKELNEKYPDIKISGNVKKGISSDAISNEADADGADLLVAGATGAGLIERTLIGSTTTAIINKSKCMVLIIPQEAKYKKIKSIVYTTDLHDDNIKTANALIPIAKQLNAELNFLFVDNKIHSDSEEISVEMSEKIKKHVEYPKLSGYICTDSDVMNGISLFIKKMNIDMVAMLTHPRSFPRMLWDTSITKKFSYHPDVPLLVLHGKAE